MDNSLLYGSIAAVGVAMLVMIVVVTLLVRRSVARGKTKPSARQPAEGKKLMHDKSSWYSQDRIRSVPGQLSTSRREASSSPSRRGYHSQDAIESPPPFTIPSYKPAVRHYHSPPNPYKQTTVPYPGVPGTYRRVDPASPTRHDVSSSRYRDERREHHNSNLNEDPGVLDVGKENEENTENGGSMSRWHSEEHLPPLRGVFESGRSGSLLSIATTDSLDSERGEGDSSPFKLLPNLELTMVWVSLSCSLSVTLCKLSNLPPKLKRSHIVVTMRLQNPSTAQHSSAGSTLPRSPTTPSGSKSFGESPHKTPKMASLMYGSRMSLSNWSLSDSSSLTSPGYKVKKSLDANFSQVFTFHDIGFFEARGSELLIQLKSRRRGPLSTKPFGEVCYKLAESNMEQDTPFFVTLEIASVKKNAPPSSTPRHLLPGQGSGLYCGSVQLTLLYQVTGHWSARVKVVILRGQGLVSPRSGGEYRVEAVVRQEGSTIAVHKTNSVATVASPVWNSPMLFDVHQAKVGDVTLEFSLVRVGRTRRSSTMGRLFVGLDTTETGSQHWSEVMAKPDKEVTVWHVLAPP